LRRLEQKFDGADPYEQALFERLSTDPDFYQEFDPTPPEPTPPV